MKDRTITEHFIYLGAPLRNHRNSWGGLRDDGVIFLRVWMHESKTINGVSHYAVLRRKVYKRTNGYNEREAHLDLIAQGAPCYLVNCRAKDQHADDMEIKSYEGAYVWPTGKIVEHEGDQYIEAFDRINVKNVLPKDVT
ncbi:hypothetical protein [Pseudomonas umsongensis]|jgi:hypothetical protein|uniref:hypothetical protein n=1 Tax=Pseudomonas umsongensis TaxID=198618 RepID=UPI0015BCC791|nr:hypothetical protein [Pseudomonas umsongensis]NWL18839.1 hypothetical protein [Pseudomonas umsongensis]